MYGQSKISLVMPVLNEAGGLSFVLKSIPDCVDEIIVVDNGSTDESVSIARRFEIRVIHEPRRGYGRAIMSGIMAAKGDIVVLSDADSTYPLDCLQEVLSYLRKGNFDFVSGCRFPLKNKRSMPILNIVSNYCISWAVRVLFKIPIYDVQSGLMVFKRRILETTRIHDLGMGFSQEIKIKAWLSGKKCAEMHIFYYVRIGKTKFRKISDALRNLWSLLSLKYKCF